MENSLQSLLHRLDDLPAQFHELREGICKAVLVAELDPEMALTRSRKVLEFIIRDVYERQVDEPPGTRPLENLLQRLVKDGHLPTRLEAYASTVRLLGNVGTHRFGETIGTEDVYQSLSQLMPVVQWYAGEHWPEADVAGCAESQPTVADNARASRPGVARPAAHVAVVPKGLRTFDAGDAKFFLDLLPGPRDENGLPESIRFWKQRIEDDKEATFAVGVLYGPSGCGKSSLVKAGLLPRLAGRVLSVYVEATAQDTEARLLKGLQRKCPDLPAELDLAGALAALRHGSGLGRTQKVLLVLDQFEQWLHAGRHAADADLVRALRQCDGQRVQALIMVRDDFWLAVSRFMADLNIELVQGQNLVLVDLFDLPHARRVLSAFGWAFGSVAEDPSPEQEAFLEQAASGLAEEGRIVPVRLALFAEMVKSKPWTPATLKEVGGAKGVGVAFLEETFSSAAASPRNRLHQQAARAVLKALLPEQGTDIKGSMRSYEQLLEGSGYAHRPKDFDELLRILDTEVRLITPTEPVEADVMGQRRATPADGKCYQLTHDYLVHSLREWMSRKQRETRRGRAELRLAEQAAFWSAKPENRHLPGWWEWLNIRLLTGPRDWTPAQRTMMRKADRHHVLRSLAWTFLLAAATLSLLVVRHQVIEQDRATHAAGLVERLLDADIAQVPGIIGDMAPYRRQVNPLLKEVYTQTERVGDGGRQLRASLALVSVDPGQVDYLFGRLLDADPHEAAVIIEQLHDYRGAFLDRLWAALEPPPKGRQGQRLPAAAALAAYDPGSPRWAQAAGPVVEQFVTVNPVLLGPWMECLRPVRAKLLDPLAAVFRQRNENRTTGRMLAAGILADFAADRPELLASLLQDADEQQFLVLLPKLEAHRTRAVALLIETVKASLDRQPTDDDKQALAHRQANAAVALLRMGQAEWVWPLLGHRPDPRVRSYLIHRLCSLGVDPAVILPQLGQGQDVSLDRALLLSLGEFDSQRLSPAQREALIPQIARRYHDDPDPGLHGAAEWLLRQWKQDRVRHELNEQWAGDAGRREQKLAQVKQDWAGSHGAARPQWYVNSQGQTMVLIPGPLESPMGSPPAEAGREGGPAGATEAQHTLRIGRCFAIAAKEVTVAQFLRFRKDHPYSRQYAPTTDCPVTPVKWYEAAAYCNWLSQQEGMREDQWCYLPNAAKEYAEGMKMAPDYLRRGGYRLPTEAEWEYACRAGAATSRYYGQSNELLGKYAWYSGTSLDRGLLPVGRLKPNDLGLFDMLGNAMEWTLGKSGKGAVAAAAADGEDREDAGDLLKIDEGVGRVSRGGSFLSYGLNVRAAFRNWLRPSYASVVVGFRPARTFP